jgi:small subunit ribosomal protein S6
MMSKEDWGLKKLAYPIQKKRVGFYHLLEFKVAGEEISAYELEFRRDDSVMRYLSVKLDKHAAAWANIRTERVISAK